MCRHCIALITVFFVATMVSSCGQGGGVNSPPTSQVQTNKTIVLSTNQRDVLSRVFGLEFLDTWSFYLADLDTRGRDWSLYAFFECPADEWQASISKRPNTTAVDFRLGHFVFTGWQVATNTYLHTANIDRVFEDAQTSHSIYFIESPGEDSKMVQIALFHYGDSLHIPGDITRAWPN